MGIGCLMEKRQSHHDSVEVDRKRKREDEEDCGGVRKMSRCWSFASDLLRKGSMFTARVAMVVQDVLRAAFTFGDVTRSRLDGDVQDMSPSFGGDDAGGGGSDTTDTDDKYQRVLASSTIVRNVPTVDIGVARPVEAMSRSELKQQLLQRLSIKTAGKGSIDRVGRGMDNNEVNLMTKKKSRGVKMLDLIDRDVPRSPGPLDTGALERGCSVRDDDDDGDKEDDQENQRNDCGPVESGEASLSSLRGSAAQEVSLLNMVQQSTDTDKLGDATSALSPEMCFIKDIDVPSTAEDVFEGFDIPDLWVRNDDVGEQGDASPVPDPCVGIEHHNVDLSPDDVCDAENAKMSPPPVRVKSMRAILRKRWSKRVCAGTEHVVEDVVFTRLREAIVNARLSEHYKNGQGWARLDASGVELDTSVDHEHLEKELVESVRKEQGEEILKKYITDIESDWKHVCAVRQKYSAEHHHDENGPPRSILKSDLSCQKSPARVRWAEEDTIKHMYCEEEYTHKQGPSKSDQIQYSTRGLRMLLASSGAKYSQSNSCGTSPPCPDMSHHPASLRLNGRSRSRTTSSVGKSQGQRLFQALQQAAPDPPTSMQQSMRAPKALSTAMQISPTRAQHDVDISS